MLLFVHDVYMLTVSEPADRFTRVQHSFGDFFAGEIPVPFEFVGAILAEREIAVPQVVTVTAHLELAKSSYACVKNMRNALIRASAYAWLPFVTNLHNIPVRIQHRK